MEVQPEQLDLLVLQVQVVSLDNQDRLDLLGPLGQLEEVVIRVSKVLQVTKVHQVLMEIWELQVNLVQVEHQELPVNQDSRVLLDHKETLGREVSLGPKVFLEILDLLDPAEGQVFLEILEEPEL